MAYSSLADYKCDDKSKYGLDKPYATIIVDYQEEVADDDTDKTHKMIRQLPVRRQMKMLHLWKKTVTMLNRIQNQTKV